MKTHFKTMLRIAISLCLLSTAAWATIVQALNLEQLSKTADVVVHGRVLSQSTAWNASHSRIYTVTTVSVTDPLKGPHKKGTAIQIRQLGGTVDGITQSIVGNAVLRTDEEVVLFLNHDPKKALHYVVGMAQGKYTVQREGKAALVRHDLRGLALADLADGRLAQLKTGEANSESAVSLPAFKTLIKGHLTGRLKAPPTSP
ncbi:MAG: hypothetical protein ACI9U2_000855 [Bradymonadia bacterium]|jgi:hypothetical protein